MGKWISIDSLSTGKQPISSLCQYNKYSQSAFENDISEFSSPYDSSSLEDRMN